MTTTLDTNKAPTKTTFDGLILIGTLHNFKTPFDGLLKCEVHNSKRVERLDIPREIRSIMGTTPLPAYEILKGGEGRRFVISVGLKFDKYTDKEGTERTAINLVALDAQPLD